MFDCRMVVVISTSSGSSIWIASEYKNCKHYFYSWPPTCRSGVREIMSHGIQTSGAELFYCRLITHKLVESHLLHFQGPKEEREGDAQLIKCNTNLSWELSETFHCV